MKGDRGTIVAKDNVTRMDPVTGCDEFGVDLGMGFDWEGMAVKDLQGACPIGLGDGGALPQSGIWK